MFVYFDSQAMQLAIASIGERANQLVFEYWTPQLFTGYLITGIKTGAYSPNVSLYDGRYDSYFGTFSVE